jgi:hypothetical protein
LVKSTDKRAVIWAFDCILYECLTGKRVFEGEAVTETLASILKDDPEWDRLPQAAPPSHSASVPKYDRSRRSALFRGHPLWNRFGRKSPPIFAAEIKVKDPTIFQAPDPVIRALDDLTRLWDLSPVRLMESRGQRLT